MRKINLAVLVLLISAAAARAERYCLECIKPIEEPAFYCTEHAAPQPQAETKWEDALGTLNPTEKIREADCLLQAGHDARNGINPFRRGDRRRLAVAKYREVLWQYPNSTAVESALYGLGAVYSDRAVGQYRRGINFFLRAYQLNPATSSDALYQAARVFDLRMTDYNQACRLYALSALTSQNSAVKTRSIARLDELHSLGFGKQYVVKVEPAANPAPETK